MHVPRTATRHTRDLLHVLAQTAAPRGLPWPPFKNLHLCALPHHPFSSSAFHVTSTRRTLPPVFPHSGICLTTPGLSSHLFTALSTVPGSQEGFNEYLLNQYAYANVGKCPRCMEWKEQVAEKDTCWMLTTGERGMYTRTRTTKCPFACTRAHVHA